MVVDDHLQEVTDVVRGADLLSSTPRQIWLQQLLGFDRPRYLHVPLVLGPDGRKLSKRDAAHPVDTDNPVDSLLDAWSFLGQPMPEERDLTPDEFWRWAVSSWKAECMRQESPQ